MDARRAGVRLVQPPPLEVDFDVQRDDDRVTIVGPDGAVAIVRTLPTDLLIQPFPWLDAADVQAARQHWVDRRIPRHVFPTCFGCGHARSAGDGLALFAGNVPDSDWCVAPWTPDPSLVDATGKLPDWMVWAALDCPSAAAVLDTLAEGTVFLLGEMAAEVTDTPVVGEAYQVVARSAGRDGRRLYSEVGLVDQGGHNLAVGRATWIIVSPN
jgi:hypothetical protein